MVRRRGYWGQDHVMNIESDLGPAVVGTLALSRMAFHISIGRWDWRLGWRSALVSVGMVGLLLR